MALSKGIWDPKPGVANIKGTNLKSLTMLLPPEAITLNNQNLAFLLQAVSKELVCYRVRIVDLGVQPFRKLVLQSYSMSSV